MKAREQDIGQDPNDHSFSAAQLSLGISACAGTALGGSRCSVVVGCSGVAAVAAVAANILAHDHDNDVGGVLAAKLRRRRHYHCRALLLLGGSRRGRGCCAAALLLGAVAADCSGGEAGAQAPDQPRRGERPFDVFLGRAGDVKEGDPAAS